ncbi:hypothetical protein [Streptomyces sp. ODS28]|uniref:hypothetical protein n=1 Tax=Streptomyces sp. ODS28 TaxID=3136688 RepID=UPI0031EBA75D
MRTRTALAGAALAAALLTGGAAATAQAAPAPAVPGAQTWIYVGTYRTAQACYNDGVNSAYSQWDCKKSSSGKWQLWVNDAS